ncbi:MAG: histidine kinase dimerization/phospho-acceptor domain-containing protein [Chloroherpetonaceae bacterium]|nr:histidine kinase dimerization/phospho-acceptor domain-containing protein [Chloroherpetonaceae bacterium]
MVAFLHQSDWQLVEVAKRVLLGEMTGSVLHELNQPLTSMSIDAGYLKMLSEKHAEIPAEMLAQIGEDIESDVQRFQKITEHLRAFAYEREKTLTAHLQKSFVSVLGLIGEQLRARSIELMVNIPPTLPAVPIDAIELEYIFLNLLLNARKAIDARQRLFPDKLFQKQISITATAEPAHLLLTVKDTGYNFSWTHRQQVGFPFATVQVATESILYSFFLVDSLLEKIGGERRVYQYLNADGMGNAIELIFPHVR